MGTSVAVLASCVASATILPGLAPILPTLVSGLLGALATYCGVNVASKWVATKANKGAKPLPGQPIEQIPE